MGRTEARRTTARARLPSWVPVAPWVADYRIAWLRSDAVAGAALFGLLIPSGMAYAQAAGLPPATGLYATIVPMIVYAAIGPSRVLVLAPDSSLAPLIAAAVLPLAAGSEARAVALAGLLAILMGLVMAAGAALRLGAVTHLLSRPIRLGYLGGLALVVVASQLPVLLGVEAQGDTPWQKLAATAGVLGETNLVALALGGGALALIGAVRAFGWKLAGVLPAVVLSALVTWAAGLGERVHVAGALPRGLPAPALGGITLADAVALLLPAAGIALMAFADTGVLSQSLARQQGQSVSGNREMAAVGIANASAGLFGGFPISGSGSRTPVAVAAGARSQLAGVFASLLVVAFMLAAPEATAYLPTATLAAVVIAAVIGLVDGPAIVRLARMSLTETALMAAAFVGVTTLGVLPGILVAVGLALLEFVRRAWSPYRAELGDLQDVPGYHDLSRHPEGVRVPGLVIARFDAPLFFANGAVFTGFVRSLVERADRDIRHVVIAAEPITGIDTTALDELVDLDEWLDGHGIELVFAELKGPVKDRLLKFGTRARFGPGHFYPTVSAAVRALRADRGDRADPEERNHDDGRDEGDGRSQGRASDAGGEPPGDGSPSRSGPPRG
ncbi:SulP family inorganic anion transporter [Sinomonas sp. R1AF57]|uniref:SulP family inorganic anion transporter n=1 Tax=Sinomonas sp. R1AF57 TaxID=2020377 RepID=UPI000B5FB72E|nr:SulP family inorganic anion transporter [Sinomonas sp. R1AF57]ASN52116.1 sodium-independent anion transporter [Sinomonas sp. R1AF57]